MFQGQEGFSSRPHLVQPAACICWQCNVPFCLKACTTGLSLLIILCTYCMQPLTKSARKLKLSTLTMRHILQEGSVSTGSGVCCRTL